MRKLIWAIGLVAAFAIPTLAQQPAKEYTLKVNTDEINSIGRGLGKLPFEDVVGLINKLKKQVEQQEQESLKSNPKDEKKDK